MTELAVPRITGLATDVPGNTSELIQLSTLLAGSEMLPKHLKQKPANLLAVMLQARALDLPMTVAFNHLVAFNGKAGMDGQLMCAVVARAGYTLYPDPSSDRDAGRARVVRVDQGVDLTIEFTFEEAVAAKLVGLDQQGRPTAKDSNGKALPWELYTNDMLIWRAVSRAARRHFSDVLMGITYTPEEVRTIEGEVVQPEGRVLEVGPSKEAQALSVRIAAAKTRAELRPILAEVRQHGLVHVEVGGIALEQRVIARGNALPEDHEPAPAAEPAPEQPAAEPASLPALAAELSKIEGPDLVGDREAEQLARTMTVETLIDHYAEAEDEDDRPAVARLIAALEQPIADVSTAELQEHLELVSTTIPAAQ